MGDRCRTVVLCSSEIPVLEAPVLAAGWDVAGTAETAFNAEHLAAAVGPDALVLQNELAGTTGVESLPDLRRNLPALPIVLVVTGEASPDLAAHLGVRAVVARGDAEGLTRALRDLDRWLDLPLAERMAERRSGHDRRIRQDWTKVGWERRHGEDRRTTPV